MTDIDDKLLEQQEQEQKEKDMVEQFEAGGNGHDREEEFETPVGDDRAKTISGARARAGKGTTR